MKQFTIKRVPPDLRCMAKEYHEFHGDTNITVAAVHVFHYKINDEIPHTVEAIETHFTDRHGKRMATMLDVWTDANGKPYIQEEEDTAGENAEEVVQAWKDSCLYCTDA